MRLLYVEIARTIWIFDIRTLNPKGLNLQPVLSKINERYGFSRFPKNLLDLSEQQTLVFDQGAFTNSQGNLMNVTFTIYNDGLSAETQSSTKDASEFLTDLCTLISKEFDLVIPPAGIMKVRYFSQIDVICEKPLISMNPKIGALLEKIEEHYSPGDGTHRKFDFGGISCWTEDAGQVGAPAPFRFERKWGTPWDTNHYFSVAPLGTEVHLEVLEELEKLLS